MVSKFKIGDKVALINDTLKGEIIKIEGTQILFENEDGFIFQYHEDELVKSENFLQQFNHYSAPKQQDKNVHHSKHKNISTKKNKLTIEVDLHIHELMENTKGMSNFEMLQVQKNKINQTLNKAILEKSQKIIFIHGVGNGVLKNELEKILKKYPVEFYDASYQKYGQGATEVYIYQNKKGY